MTKFNLKTLDGVISWSILTGVMLAVLISAQVDVSETAILITVLEAIANAFGYDTTLITIVTVSVTIIEMIILYRTIWNMGETHGLVGMIVSGLGFFGALLLVLGEIPIATVGAFMIMAGYGIIRFVD